MDRADAEPCIGVLLWRVLEVHFWSLAAMLAVVELCWSGSDLCCQNIGCFAEARYEFFMVPLPSGVFLALGDASVASLDLSVVLGRRTFNRVVEGAGRGPYRPSPPTRAGAPDGPRSRVYCLCCDAKKSKKKRNHITGQ